MNYLIGDIGNTNIKICKINSNFKIINTYLFETKKSNFETNLNRRLKKIIKKNTNKNVLFSSVVPKIYKKISRIFRKNNLNVFEIKKFNLKKIMKFNVKKYSQLGSDRIANAIGAMDYKNNFIILDFGTATTFDVLIKNFYHGGVIAPGLKISLNNLIDKATLIPQINLKRINKVIGLNTVNAVRSGFFWGYIGLIENILKLIKKETKKPFKIIITGGYSNLFKKSFNTIAIINKDITMKGLMKASKLIS